MLFVYQTPAFEKRVAKDFKGLCACVKTLIDRIEKRQEYTGFVPFPDCFFVKKKLMYKYRLIARTVTIDAGEVDDEEHELLVFHDMMIRKDPDYNNPNSSDCFCKDPEGYAKKHQYITENFEKECLEYCKKRLKEKNGFKPKKPVSDYENQLLYDQLNGIQENTGNLDIYETREWVSSLKSEENKDIYDTYLHNLYAAVVDAVKKAAASDSPVGWDVQEVECGSRNKKYFSYYYNIDQMVFILGRIDQSDTLAYEFIEKQERLYENFNKEKDLKKTLRSYPETIVSDEKDLDLWKNIEHELSNNMSLSSEELRILNRTLDSQTRAYPLFINGRAGSGKSTILQSLFTPYYFQYLKSENPQDASPVYFTYNEKLKICARETVSKLLQNHRYIGSKQLDDSEKSRITDKDGANWKNVFRQFTDFLLEVAKVRKGGYEFRDKCKIDFARFRKLFLERFGKERDLLKKAPPEICWHVIRTYIKGDSVDALMDLEEFKSEKNRTVSEDTFRCVYDKVWRPWYSTITLFADKGEGEFAQNVRPEYWDEQDLVRYILMEDEEHDGDSLLDQYFETKPRFSAIFCDESQDFTHIELEAIPEMSLYLYRKVDRNYIKKIPFVFAGDPFQTLNPTGFSWEATERGFVDIIARALDKKAAHVSLVYEELKMNYRSAASIVKVSNAVQAVRAAKLNPDKEKIEPQRPWNDTKGSCLFFDWNDAEVWDWLENNDDVSFVLPCDSSNRADFIASHPSLAEHLGFDSVKRDISSCKFPVYSALDIKGLEYDKVVVYGFGAFDEDPTNGQSGRFRKLLEGNASLQGDQNLEMEYFINRLYVSVTRSKKKLFVLDNSDCTFWNKFKESKDGDTVQWLSSILPDNCKKSWVEDGDTVESHLDVLQMGRISDLDGESAGEDRETFAEQLLSDGIENANVERLGSALRRFSGIKGENSSKCSEIRGCIYYLDKKFEQSADFFEKGGRPVASNHSLFLASNLEDAEIFSRMKSLARKKTDCEDSAEYALVRCCVDQPSDLNFLDALDKFDKLYADYSRKSGHEIFAWKYDFERWEALFNKALGRLPGCKPENSKINKVNENMVAERLLAQEDLQFDEVLVAQFLMHVEKYDELRKIAEKSDNAKVKELARRARALDRPFPENLHSLNESNDHATIYDVFKEKCAEDRGNVVKVMDGGDSKIVLDAMTTLNAPFNEDYFGILFNKYMDSDVWDKYVKGLKSIRNLNDKEMNVKIVWNAVKNLNSAEIVAEMRKCNTVKDEKLFNKFFIYCCVASKCHLNAKDLAGCPGMLKDVFFDTKENAIIKYDLSVNDVVEIGAFYEYVAELAGKLSNDKSKQNSNLINQWKRALEFYNKALKDLKKTNLLLVQKRIVFCEERLAELYAVEATAAKHRQNVFGGYNSDAEVAKTYEKEAEDHRSQWGISGSIDKSEKGKDEGKWANELACRLWRGDGYLIKHTPVIAEAQAVETPIAAPVVKTAAEPVVAAAPVAEPASEAAELAVVETAALADVAAPAATEAPKVAEPVVAPAVEPEVKTPAVAAPAAEPGAPAVEIADKVEEPEKVETPVVDETPAPVEKVEAVVVELAKKNPEMSENKNSVVESDSQYPESFKLECKGYEFVTRVVDDLYSLEIYAVNPRVRLCRINSDGITFGRASKGVIHDGGQLGYGSLEKITLVEEESGECKVSIGRWSFSVTLN
ncbi:MAG: hypothetical protein MJY85_00705 [Fibrobacter sp.]|nr:hypothetical protein [Fibrobacter sp.]